MSYAPVGRWAARSACRDRTADMVVHGEQAINDQRHNEQARQICNTCPVQDECRQWALTEPDPAEGMMAGGLTPNDRDSASARRPRTRTWQPTQRPPCGTNKGYHWHWRHNEPPCQACCDAHSLHRALTKQRETV